MYLYKYLKNKDKNISMHVYAAMIADMKICMLPNMHKNKQLQKKHRSLLVQSIDNHVKKIKEQQNKNEEKA